MNLSAIDRMEMVRKRQAYFSAVAEEYASFTDFIKAQDMWLGIMGIGLTDCGQYLKLYIQLDFSEYEEYYVVMGDNEHLTVSEIVMRNGDCLCMDCINVGTGKLTDKESIYKSE
jgi:hypothetical protein